MVAWIAANWGKPWKCLVDIRLMSNRAGVDEKVARCRLTAWN
jgi:hypothetical protein